MKHSRWAVAMLALAVSGLFCSFAWQDPEGARSAAKAAPPKSLPVTTVIFARHAEAEERTRTQRNPDLREVGKQRAKRLGETLHAAGVTRVFATEYARTQQTAAAIAKATGRKVESYEARNGAAFAEKLRQLPGGEVVVVIGHSNTVPVLVKALGGKLEGLDARGFLDESEHDRLVFVTLAQGKDGEPRRAAQTIDLRIDL